MRIKLETHPNSDCLTIHLDRLVTTHPILRYEQHDNGKTMGYSHEVHSPIVYDLFQQPGLVSVTLSDYHISLVKGQAFTWLELLNYILVTVLKHMDTEAAIIHVKLTPCREVKEPDSPIEIHTYHLAKSGC